MVEPKIVVRAIRIPTGQMVVTIPKDIPQLLLASGVDYMVMYRRGATIIIEPMERHE